MRRVEQNIWERRQGLDRTRRAALAGVASVAFAGCTGTSDDQTVPYRHLESEPLYIGPSFNVGLPETVTRTKEPTAATLIVLSRETTISGTRVVGWLRDGIPVAIAGQPAKPVLLSLLNAGSYRRFFDSNIGAENREEYLVAAVEPDVDEEWLTTLLADSEFDSPVAYALDDVLSGVVSKRTPISIK